MRRVAVFCGARSGHKPQYCQLAAALGRALAERGLGIVYGGGTVGMMGALADAALAAGGEVIGVIPQSLVARELVHPGVRDLRVTEDLQTRKAVMVELADAFIALPGGFGTLDELFELITWRQLGFQTRPVGLLNCRGYFDQLLAFLDTAVTEGFLQPEERELLHASDELGTLLDAMVR
jgi:uncharacterized protein (TIGR00730 family)